MIWEWGSGAGENPQTPRSPQAKPGNMVLLQGIFTSFRVGNKKGNLGQDGNMRALPHLQPPLQTTHHIPGAQLPWHKDLRVYSTQSFALLTLRLSRSSSPLPPQTQIFQNGHPAPLPHLQPLTLLSFFPAPAGQAAPGPAVGPESRVAQESRPPSAPIGRLRPA